MSKIQIPAEYKAFEDKFSALAYGQEDVYKRQGSHTAGIPAVQAARRFQPCLVEVVTIADLLELGRADLRVLFAHGDARYLVCH